MKFKNVCLLAAASLALSTSAFAADLPEAVAPEVALPVVAPFSWTGLYVGVNVGYGCCGDDKVGIFEQDAGNREFLGNVGNLQVSGIFGGGQIGYNYQFSSFVIGLEADIQASGMDDTLGNRNFSLAVPGGSITGAKSEIDWFGTVRARAGFAWDRALIYGTGGVAFGGVNYKVNGIVDGDDDGEGISSISQSNTDVGYAVGGGVEYAFTNHITAKLEYQYVNLGKDTISGGTNLAGTSFITHPTPDFHTVRVGLNYKF